MNILKSLSSILMKPLSLLENKYIAGGVKIFLIVYAATIAPKLPNFLARALQNPLVKLLILFLIVYTGIKDPVTSLLIAIGFTVSMQTLNKMETSSSLSELIRDAVDVPQSLLNDTVDGAQEIIGGGASLLGKAPIVGGPIEEVVGVTNKLVDAVQDVTNKVIDGTQDLAENTVSKVLNGVKDMIVPKKENFSMEDRTLDVEVPDMGMLDGLSGFSGDEVGASVEFTEPASLQ